MDEKETQLVERGYNRIARTAAALMRREDEEGVVEGAVSRADYEKWEKKAIKDMFGLDSDSSSEASADDISADPDYEEKLPHVGCVDSSQSSRGDIVSSDIDEDAEDEEGTRTPVDPTPNFHRSPPDSHQTYDLRVKRSVPSWFRGFKTTFKSWKHFLKAFDSFQFETCQRFTKRTTTSVASRNNQMLALFKARKRAGKKSRKEVELIPKEWQMYSQTLVCTHGQPYEPKGNGERYHSNIRDTKCKARVNVRVTVSVSGSWYLCVNPSGEHNHALNKRTFESYAENRTVKDAQLTRDVAILHKAGAKAKGILRYLREQTGRQILCGFGSYVLCEYGSYVL
ncbi:hypothetical protein DVH05_014913 [Phytophthora capsici]|nr:hypothetical protein DVH05_019316 [Phytophthora capsici]KAG1698398.1 hypothetical protein DVH05_014913 [Phytophthora capsici]